MNEMLINESTKKQIKVSVQLEKETAWPNLLQLARLFARGRSVIGKYIRNIFKEKELGEKVLCANITHTTYYGAIAGQTQAKELKYFKLDVIISLG